MADNLAAIDVAGNLARAEQAGADKYIAMVSALEAAGAAVPYAARTRADQLRQTAAGMPPSAGGNVSAGAVVDHLDAMSARGVPAEQVRALAAAEGIPDFEPDQRTDRQRAADRAFQMPRFIDETKFSVPYSREQTESVDPTAIARYDEDLKGFTADLHFSEAMAGSRFANSVNSTVNSMRGWSAEQRAEQVVKWEEQLRAAYKDKFDEYADQVKNYLDAMASDAKFLADLRRTGALANPNVFASILGRSQVVTLWRQARG